MRVITVRAAKYNAGVVFALVRYFPLDCGVFIIEADMTHIVITTPKYAMPQQIIDQIRAAAVGHIVAFNTECEV